eukprot:2828407-Rhodomonas_salina.6
MTVAQGSGLTATVAGVSTSFSISSLDKYGNQRVVQTSPPKSSVLGPKSREISEKNHALGIVGALATEATNFECLFIGPGTTSAIAYAISYAISYAHGTICPVLRLRMPVPDPRDQTLLFPGATAPRFLGSVLGLSGMCSELITP